MAGLDEGKVTPTKHLSALQDSSKELALDDWSFTAAPLKYDSQSHCVLQRQNYPGAENPTPVLSVCAQSDLRRMG